MALYVYGVVGAGTPVPTDDRGLGDVQGVQDGELVAVCSQVAEDPVGRRRELKAHADVLSELAHTSAVVPFTFGTVLPDEARVHDMLSTRASHLGGELDRLADVVQMTVRLVPDEQLLVADVMASSPPLRELEARVRRSRGTGSQAQQLRLGEAVARHYRDWVERLSTTAVDALAPHSREVRIESDPSTTDPVQAAFLVERDQVSAFLEAGGAVADGMHGRMVCRIVGPLPPYSFVASEDHTPASVT